MKWKACARAWHFRGLARFLIGCAMLSCLSPVAAEIVRFEGATMGTYYSIAVDSKQEVDIPSLQERVDARLEEVNRQMSTWVSDSEISKFNRQESLEWVDVSEDFARVVTEARRIYDLSNGAFDPTVSPLIALWGFSDHKPRKIPSQKQIDKALAATGMQTIEVRLNPPGLRKQIPGIQLNLSAIAKGFGVDVVAELLEDQGYSAYVVDIGGEDRAGLPKLDGTFWRLGVESPLGGIQKVIRLAESSIATSGDYRNYFTMGQRRFSHAINPRTGWPVENPPASVSVIHSSCMTADALATALMVLGTQEGMQLARSEGLEVMFLDVVGQAASDDDEVRISATGRFAEEDPAEQVLEPSAVDSNRTEPQMSQSDFPPAADGREDGGPRDNWWRPVLAAAGIFALAMIGMAIGVLFRNKSLKGSCGGIAAFDGDHGHSVCELCTKPKEECINTELRERMQSSANRTPSDQE